MHNSLRSGNECKFPEILTPLSILINHKGDSSRIALFLCPNLRKFYPETPRAPTFQAKPFQKSSGVGQTGPTPLALYGAMQLRWSKVISAPLLLPLYHSSSARRSRPFEAVRGDDLGGRSEPLLLLRPKQQPNAQQ